MGCSFTLQKYMVGQELFLEFSFKAFYVFEIICDPTSNSLAIPYLKWDIYIFLN